MEDKNSTVTEAPQSTEGTVTEVPQNTESTVTEAPQSTESTVTEAPQSTEGTATEAPQSTEGTVTEAPQNTEGTATGAPQNTEGTVTIAKEESERKEQVTETVVAPTPPPAPPKSGNWGTVALILLLIAAAGAALAVVILRGKNKNMKKVYHEIEGQNFATEVSRETSSSSPSSSISCGMAQTIGKREQQQDSLYCSNWKDPNALLTRGLLAAVADGIGGLQDGNLASQNAMQAVRTVFLESSGGESPSDRLLSCAAAAQKSVLKLNESSSCGATLVSVLITGRTMQFLSIGDSRIYLYRAGALLQLNREHILRRENEEKEALYGAGEQLTRKRAGALTSYLGKSNLTQIDRSLQPMQLLPGDRIALMSDGVFNALSEQEIIAHLRKDPESAAQDMIRSVDALNHPSQDNATVVVVGIE